jgi:osmotically-inducible protein OsmY
VTDTLAGTGSAALGAAAHEALARTGHAWLRRVEVTVEAGRVVLRGDVPSYYLKQMAQVTVLALPDVPGLENDLRVTAGRDPTD